MSSFIKVVEAKAVERISPKAKLYTEEIYTKELWQKDDGSKFYKYKISTETLNHKNGHTKHYEMYELKEDWEESWEQRCEQEGYNIVTVNLDDINRNEKEKY